MCRPDVPEGTRVVLLCCMIQLTDEPDRVVKLTNIIDSEQFHDVTSSSTTPDDLKSVTVHGAKIEVSVHGLHSARI